MVDRKAIVPKDNSHITFDVNFAIVQKEFPQYLHELVLVTLNQVERAFYESGIMAFEVTPDGFLSWKPTFKVL